MIIVINRHSQHCTDYLPVAWWLAGNVAFLAHTYANEAEFTALNDSYLADPHYWEGFQS